MLKSLLFLTRSSSFYLLWWLEKFIRIWLVWDPKQISEASEKGPNYKFYVVFEKLMVAAGYIGALYLLPDTAWYLLGTFIFGWILLILEDYYGEPWSSLGGVALGMLMVQIVKLVGASP